MASLKSKATPKSIQAPKRTPKPPVEESESEVEDSDMDSPESTPKTTPKPDASAMRSVKRKRVETAEDEDDEVKGEAIVRSVVSKLGAAEALSATAKLSEHFGVEDGWAGYQIFHAMDKGMKKMMKQTVWIWFTIACALDYAGRFGPNLSYNAHSVLGVTNFFIEQFGVRPEFCHRYPSPGKTYMFLLALAPEVATKLLKLPRGWIKLAHGLGCRIRVPTSDPITSVSVHVTGVLPIVPEQELSERLRAIPGVKSIQGGFERVVLENNVATDRVACCLALKNDENLPFDAYAEKFEHSLEIGGLSLKVERRTSCLVCGEDTHLQYVCSTKQRLVSGEMSTWSFVSEVVPKSKPEAQSGDAPKSKKARKGRGKGKEQAPRPEEKKAGQGSGSKRAGADA
ncbi:hypothetical protein DFH29DRAFT_970354 [Suillus ampliporus]|nr:hypothetical protein DFH29DRAFT_970354 [Suillus ampliporus]